MLALYIRLSSLLSDLLPEREEREEGQGLAEYALILVLIAIVCFIALQILGTNISQVLSTVSSGL